MVLESCDYTHFTPKHVTNDILKYQFSKIMASENQLLWDGQMMYSSKDKNYKGWRGGVIKYK